MVLVPALSPYRLLPVLWGCTKLFQPVLVCDPAPDVAAHDAPAVDSVVAPVLGVLAARSVVSGGAPHAAEAARKVIIRAIPASAAARAKFPAAQLLRASASVAGTAPS